MAFPATLWVKQGKRCWRAYAAYDGYLANVFPQLASTVAAVGLAAVREAFAKLTLGSAQEEPELAYDRYLAAATIAGKPPHLLLEIMQGAYGVFDFAHGGVIPLFASVLAHHPLACKREQDAEYVLDLDQGLLRHRVCFEVGRGELCLPLEKLMDLVPEDVEAGLTDLLDTPRFKMGAADELGIAQAQLEGALVALGALKPKPSFGEKPGFDGDIGYALPAEQLKALGSMRCTGAGEHGRLVYIFEGGTEQLPLLRSLESTLARWGQERKGLKRLSSAQFLARPQRGGALRVDFSEGFSSPRQAAAIEGLFDALYALAADLGLRCQVEGGTGKGIDLLGIQPGIGVESPATVEISAPLRSADELLASATEAAANLRTARVGEPARYIGEGKLPLYEKVVVRKLEKAHAWVKSSSGLIVAEPLLAADLLPEDEGAMLHWQRLNSAHVAARVLLEHEVIAALPWARHLHLLAPLVEQGLNQMTRIWQAFEPDYPARRWQKMPPSSRDEILALLRPSARFALQSLVNRSPPWR